MYMHFFLHSCSDNCFLKELLSLLWKLSDFWVLSGFLLNMPKTSSSKMFRVIAALWRMPSGIFCPWQKKTHVWVCWEFFGFFFLLVCPPSPLNSEYTFPRVKEFTCLWSGGELSYDLHGSFLWSRTGVQPLIHFQDKVSTVYWHILDKLVFISWFIWHLIKGCLCFV